MLRYSDLFVGNDVKGEVRSEWSNLFQALHRHKFLVTLDIKKANSGGKDIEEATTEYVQMFNHMEEWCDINCTGLWSTWDNEGEVSEDAPEVELEIHFMFEFEDDLIRFIRDCAVLAKLSLS